MLSVPDGMVCMAMMCMCGIDIYCVLTRPFALSCCCVFSVSLSYTNLSNDRLRNKLYESLMTVIQDGIYLMF